MFVLCLAQKGSLGVIFIAVLNNSIYRFLEVGGKGLAVDPLKCDLVDYLCSGSCNTGDVVWLCSLTCGFIHPRRCLFLVSWCWADLHGHFQQWMSSLETFTFGLDESYQRAGIATTACAYRRDLNGVMLYHMSLFMRLMGYSIS